MTTSTTTMSNNIMKRHNVSSSANVLMCKQWWKVCWMYGDQEKYYRQLYGKKLNHKNEHFKKYENTTTNENIALNRLNRDSDVRTLGTFNFPEYFSNVDNKTDSKTLVNTSPLDSLDMSNGGGSDE